MVNCVVDKEVMFGKGMSIECMSILIGWKLGYSVLCSDTQSLFAPSPWKYSFHEWTLYYTWFSVHTILLTVCLD